MPSMRVPIKKRQAWLRCARSDMVEREMIDSTAVIDRYYPSPRKLGQSMRGEALKKAVTRFTYSPVTT